MDSVDIESPLKVMIPRVRRLGQLANAAEPGMLAARVPETTLLHLTVAGGIIEVMADPPETPKLRWFRPTPGRFLLVLLAVEGLLWLSDWLRWPAWHKGYAVLTAVAVVAGAVVLMVLWFVASLVFRWRFQFSIRSLLVLTVAVAAACSWLAVEMKKAREQRGALQAIEKELFGLTLFDYQLDSSGQLMSPAEPKEPAWLRDALGEQFFRSPVYVSLNQDNVDTWWAAGEDYRMISDADLAHLAGFTQLRFLFLVRTRVTDTGLDQLKGFAQLRYLNVQNTNVTDAGVAKLQQALPDCKIER